MTQNIETVKRGTPAIDRIRNIGWTEEQRVEGVTPCWIFNGATNIKTGYGSVSIRQGVKDYVHRVVLAEKLGRPLEKGEVAMHVVCDQPSCCNPDHLEVGTQADNMRDAARKGRMSSRKGGTVRHYSMETWAEAERLYEQGATRTQVAEQTGIHPGTVQAAFGPRHMLPKRYLAWKAQQHSLAA